MDSFGDIVRIPDFWQSGALEHLKAGRDVVIDAPTGAGKTYVFEMFVEKFFSGRAVYTVPTRALANDKYQQWRERGWRVGISTGDYCENPDAPVVVATLETQKNGFFERRCPDLLVIDEYQLISNPVRGFNYELAVALAPKTTQLLLLSGSVENTADVLKWFKRLGRDCRVVSHAERAVPLEEVAAAALPDGDSRGVYGAWPKLVKKIIDADMAPVLIFAPHRAEAESLARKLAAELPCPDFLNLPKDVASAAGRELANMMRKRVAFHHSGLSAHQRSAVVEKYARDGRLNVVVSTTGLGAGVNFSMRSVLVVSREYETVSGTQTLSPDELLQMFGRAGRRGKDKVGYAVFLPSKPRLSEAKQCVLRRIDAVDAATSIRIMARAADEGRDCVEALKNFYSRLFTESEIDIGWDCVAAAKSRRARRSEPKRGAVCVEILNSKNMWERRRVKSAFPAREVLFFDGEKWGGFLQSAKAVAEIGIGRVKRLENGDFGVGIEVAFLRDGAYCFTKAARKILARARSADAAFKRYFREDAPTLKNIKRNFPRFLEAVFAGARVVSIAETNGRVFADLNLENAKISAFVDAYGARLFRPPEREVDVSGEFDFRALSGLAAVSAVPDSPAAQWRAFGFVDDAFVPTLRGRIFSFFNGGEGFAVAAAIEDASYDISDLVFDLANLRAGGRFHLSQSKASVSSRLADCCRTAFLSANVAGALKAGVPLTYGDGASEIMRELRGGAQMARFENDLILRGDIERAYLEWKSILRHIAFLPELESERWRALKAAARRLI